jgi:hypothetical protein
VVNAVQRRPEAKDSEKWIRGVWCLRFLVGSGVRIAEFSKKNAIAGLVRRLLQEWVFEIRILALRDP